MKKIIKITLFSSFIGFILASLFFGNIKEKASAKNKNIITAFQTGVFKSEENALVFQKRYKKSLLVKDKDYYRIFVAITTNNKELLEEHFKELKIDYYLKEVEVTPKIYEELYKYDELLKNKNLENKEEIINKMLESYKNELQN